MFCVSTAPQPHQSAVLHQKTEKTNSLVMVLLAARVMSVFVFWHLRIDKSEFRFRMRIINDA